jgi:alanine racemase
MSRAEIVVDLAAIRANVATLRARTTPAQFMAVVKADGYGHGMVLVARAAREAGADWLGVATIDEAIALREAGDTGPILSWLTVPGEDWAAAVNRDVDLTAYSQGELAEIAAVEGAKPARVQLKIDTGLSRGGATAEEWPALVSAARAAEQRGEITVTGIWSHLASSDEPDHPANAAQHKAFAEALEVADSAGLRPEVRHLANSAAAILDADARYDLVRCGIATYGLDPAPAVPHGTPLVPAMTVRGRLAVVKDLAEGAGVSYGHTWIADHPTTVAVVPAGYGEGIPRHAGNSASVWVGGKQRPIRGRICMDQFVVDLDHDPAVPGDEVILFGPGTHGEPTAQDWAQACGTINYEIVTRIGGRLTRSYVDSTRDRGAGA